VALSGLEFRAREVRKASSSEVLSVTDVWELKTNHIDTPQLLSIPRDLLKLDDILIN